MGLKEKIFELRDIKGITQEELAEMIGLKRSIISKYENGKRIPKLKTLEKLAEALGVPVAYFFESKTTKIHQIEFVLIEGKSCIVFVPSYYIERNSSESDNLIAQPKVTTDCTGIPDGYYIWISSQSLNFNSLTINRSTRLLIRYCDSPPVCNEIILFKTDDNKYRLGEVSEKHGNLCIVYEADRQKQYIDIDRILLLGNMVQLALNL